MFKIINKLVESLPVYAFRRSVRKTFRNTVIK